MSIFHGTNSMPVSRTQERDTGPFEREKWNGNQVEPMGGRERNKRIKIV